MSYKIYELVKPEVLKKTEPDGYHIKTTELITLKEVDGLASGLEYSYNSELEARTAIIYNKDKLKQKDLVILPMLSVNWDGEVS